MTGAGRRQEDAPDSHREGILFRGLCDTEAVQD